MKHRPPGIPAPGRRGPSPDVGASQPWKRWLACALLAVGAAPTAFGQAPEPAPAWQLEMRSSRHSDFGSLADLDSEEPAAFTARSGRNLAYVDDELRATHMRGAWSFSLLARSTATLVANRDAVSALHSAAGLTSHTGNEHWAVDARLRGFNGYGVELGRSLALGGNWRLSAAVQALALTRWRDQHIGGTLDFDATTARYSFDLHSRMVNDRLRLPFQDSFATRGAGLLASSTLAWQSGQWGWDLSLRDLGWLHWRGIPRQEFTLSSSTHAVDAQGFVIYRPLLQGRNSQSGHTHQQSGRWATQLHWRATGTGTASAAVDWMPGFGALPSLRWQQRWEGFSTEFGWRFHERAAMAGIRWRGLALGISTSVGSHRSSRALSLTYALP